MCPCSPWSPIDGQRRESFQSHPLALGLKRSLVAKMNKYFLVTNSSGNVS